MQVSEEIAYKLVGTAAGPTIDFLHAKFSKCKLAFASSDRADRTIICQTQHPKTQRGHCAIRWLQEQA